ncbi:MAG: PadR family transcriptional regulator [Bryobacteraceae bacterium]
MEIDPQFLKGSIILLLLNLLSRGEMYGYEILQEASRRSANAFAENGRERKYYSLTAKGKKTAREYENQWQHLTGAIAAVLESK